MFDILFSDFILFLVFFLCMAHNVSKSFRRLLSKFSFWLPLLHTFRLFFCKGTAQKP